MHHPELHSQLVNDRTMKHLQIKQTVKFFENDIDFPTYRIKFVINVEGSIQAFSCIVFF